MNIKPECFIRSDRCSHCGRCIAVCPAAAIEFSALGLPEIRKKSCRRCGACKKICKQGAIGSRVRLTC